MRYCSMKLLQMHRQPFHLASDFGGLQRAILAAMNYHTRKHAGRIDSKKKIVFNVRNLHINRRVDRAFASSTSQCCSSMLAYIYIRVCGHMHLYMIYLVLFYL